MSTKELLENAVHELRNVALIVRRSKGEPSDNADRICAVAGSLMVELARIQREPPLCRECHRPCPIIGKAPPEGPICGPCREDER